MFLILLWPLTNLGSREPELATSSPPAKPYKIFIVEHAHISPNKLHQIEQIETITITELKINIAQLIQIPPDMFKLVLDHKKEYADTFENEPYRTLKSYFADTQSAWLFTLPLYQHTVAASSSSSMQPALPITAQDSADQLEDIELTQIVEEWYIK